MKIDILTIFPDFFRGPLDYGIVRRARETGLVEISIHDLRAFTKDKHRTVDDRPFGGGEGMVLKPEPIFECLESFGDVASREARLSAGAKQSVILLSAQGRRLDQALAAELSRARPDRPDLRTLRRRGRTHQRAPGGSRSFDRRLCAERRRTGRGGDCGHGHAADPGRGGQPEFDAAGVVHESCATGGVWPATDRVRPAFPADCSTIRITRGPRIFAAWRCRKCW